MAPRLGRADLLGGLRGADDVEPIERGLFGPLHLVDVTAERLGRDLEHEVLGQGRIATGDQALAGAVLVGAFGASG